MIILCEPIIVQMDFPDTISVSVNKEEIVSVEMLNGPGFPEYQGPTTFTPTVQTQTVATKDKVVTNNLTILPVPYSQVLNPSGGYTITIL